jgi:hypothetical protein
MGSRGRVLEDEWRLLKVNTSEAKSTGDLKHMDACVPELVNTQRVTFPSSNVALTYKYSTSMV